MINVPCAEPSTVSEDEPPSIVPSLLTAAELFAPVQSSGLSLRSRRTAPLPIEYRFVPLIVIRPSTRPPGGTEFGIGSSLAMVADAEAPELSMTAPTGAL